MKLIPLNIIAVAFIFLGLMAGCTGKQKSLAIQRGSDAENGNPTLSVSPSASPRPSPAVSPSPSPSPTIIPSVGYDPLGGDTFTLQRQMKSWISTTSQPSTFTSMPTVESIVVGLYEPGMQCQYKVKETTSGVSTVSNRRCKTLNCGTATSNCTQTNLETRNFGSFTGAVGLKTVCDSVNSYVIGVATTRTLTHSETSQWTHGDALRDGQVVHAEYYTCSYSDDGVADATKITPCAPPAGGSAANLSLLIEDLSQQRRGAGTTNINVEAKSDFSVSGAFTTPTERLSQPATCSINTDKISINLSQFYCKGVNPSIYFLSLSGLPAQDSSNVATGAYSVLFSANLVTYMATDAEACSVTYALNPATKMISGSALCKNPISDLALTAAVTLSNISFTCDAPATGYTAGGNPSASPTPSPSPTPTPTVSPTPIPSASPSPSPSSKPSPTPTASPSPTPSASPSPSPSSTPSPTPKASPSPSPSSITIAIPLECAHVVFNEDYVKGKAATYPQYEKNCKIDFDLADYYPAARNRSYSKIDLDFKSYGWATMAPDLVKPPLTKGYFENLQDSLGKKHECLARLSDRQAGFVSASFISFSPLRLGYYYADPNPNPTAPPFPGAGSKETNQSDWLTPLYNGYSHERFRAEYTPSPGHHFYIEYKLNGVGSCSKTNGCGACISNIFVTVRP